MSGRRWSGNVPIVARSQAPSRFGNCDAPPDHSSIPTWCRHSWPPAALWSEPEVGRECTSAGALRTPPRAAAHARAGTRLCASPVGPHARSLSTPIGPGHYPERESALSRETQCHTTQPPAMQPPDGFAAEVDGGPYDPLTAGCVQPKAPPRAAPAIEGGRQAQGVSAATAGLKLGRDGGR